MILACLGKAHLEAGDATQAIPMLEQAVELADQVRSRQWRAWFRTWLGEAYLVGRKLGEARRVMGQTLEICTDVEFVAGVGFSNQALGRIAQAEGALPEAEKCLTDALRARTRSVRGSRWGALACSWRHSLPSGETAERLPRTSGRRTPCSGPCESPSTSSGPRSSLGSLGRDRSLSLDLVFVRPPVGAVRHRDVRMAPEGRVQPRSLICRWDFGQTKWATRAPPSPCADAGNPGWPAPPHQTGSPARRGWRGRPFPHG